MRKARIFRGIAAVLALVLVITVAGSTIMFENAGMINQALNITTSMLVNQETDADVNTRPQKMWRRRRKGRFC